MIDGWNSFGQMVSEAQEAWNGGSMVARSGFCEKRAVTASKAGPNKNVRFGRNLTAILRL